MKWPTLEQSLARFHELEHQLATPAVIADRQRYAHAAKEHGALAKRVKPYLEYQKIEADIAQAEAVIAAETDAEMRRYAEDELQSLRGRHQELERRLEEL